MARRTTVLLSLLLSIAPAAAASADEVPVAVSPGNPSGLALVESRCPTFSWGAAEGVVKYEIAVVDAEAGDAEDPLLRQEIPGSATSWTPSLESCFPPGGHYAWSVRAVLEEGVSAWSSTRFFRIAERKQLEELLDAQGAIAPAAIAADALASGLVQPASASTAAAPDGNRELAMAAPASPAVSIDGLVAAGAFLGAGVVPTGAVLPFAGPASAVPQGWLLCDGLELDPDTHPQLYAVLGTAHGGNAPFSFRIPDYRGFFLRGVDGGAGVDPDASTRLAMAPGGNTGNAVGSVQLHQFQTHSHSTTSHSHTINPGGNHQHGVLGDTAPNIYLRLNDDGGASGVNSVDSSNESGNVGPIVTTFSGSHGHSASSNSGTVTDPNSGSHGSETRPENVYVNFIIRCGPGDAC